jgi:hypothetical protein
MEGEGEWCQRKMTRERGMPRQREMVKEGNAVREGNVVRESKTSDVREERCQKGVL